jgi:hypothetical protein
VPKFTASGTIGNSAIQDSGSALTFGLASTFTGNVSVNSTNSKTGGTAWNLNIRDNTSLAANTGGGISFQGVYTTGGSIGNFGAISSYKTNATSGNESGGLKFYYSANGIITQGLQISETGAATFSSSVTVSTGVRFGNGSTNLNYYEEGTWTPTFTAATSGTITVDSANTTARYTRIGRQVTVNGTFTVSSVSSPVGEWRIYGLPFTSAGGAGARTAVSVLADSLQATATTSIVGYVDVSVTFITLYKYTAGSVLTLAGDVKAGSYVFVTATYFV